MSGNMPSFLGQTIYLDTALLDKITVEMRPKARKIVNKYGLAITSSWAADVNVDTSAFRNSILSESKMTDDLTFTASDGVEYGIWQELGHGSVAAKPSLSQAFEMWREKFLTAFSELFK
jgi:hypothetical protein